jgi:hypothetical protein
VKGGPIAWNETESGKQGGDRLLPSAGCQASTEKELIPFSMIQAGLVQKPLFRDAALYLNFLRLSAYLLGRVKKETL